jgi:hypothetical protein
MHMFWGGSTCVFKMPSSGMWCHVALVRTYMLEEHITSIIKVKRISELGTMLAITSNSSLLLLTFLACWFFSLWWWRWYVPPKHWFLQEPHGITSQKMAFFIITAIKVLNLTTYVLWCVWSDTVVTMQHFCRCYATASWLSPWIHSPPQYCCVA